GIDARKKLLEPLVRRAHLLQLAGDSAQEILRGPAAIVLDVGQMRCRDLELRSQPAKGESRPQPQPADLLTEMWRSHVSYVSFLCERGQDLSQAVLAMLWNFLPSTTATTSQTSTSPAFTRANSFEANPSHVVPANTIPADITSPNRTKNVSFACF